MGRRPLAARAMTDAERQSRYRQRLAVDRIDLSASANEIVKKLIEQLDPQKRHLVIDYLLKRQRKTRAGRTCN